ncbi:MAG: hypothetical protein FK730_10700 [Asgard group archaeon]|nr:hypothetical protein [Asgard group archaeon]
MPLKNKTKIISYAIIVTMLFLPVISVKVTAGEFVGVYAGINEITVTTSEMTMKIIDYKPNFIYWIYNQSTSDEKYCIKFTKIQEYFGTDSYLDSIIELGGISYNLQTSDWDSTITDDDYNVNINLTLSGLANNVVIQFLMHISGFLRNMDHTSENIYPFRECEIEITVRNWIFTPGAKGFAFKLEIFELTKINDINLINNTYLYDNIEALEFRSDKGYPHEKASCKWLKVADYYNDTLYNSTINVGNAFFNETYSPPEDEITHLWLSYPKVDDSFTVTHTNIIGLNEQYPSPTMVAGPIFFSTISLLIFFNIVFIVFRKKKLGNIQ